METISVEGDDAPMPRVKRRYSWTVAPLPGTEAVCLLSDLFSLRQSMVAVPPSTADDTNVPTDNCEGGTTSIQPAFAAFMKRLVAEKHYTVATTEPIIAEWFLHLITPLPGGSIDEAVFGAMAKGG